MRSKTLQCAMVVALFTVLSAHAQTPDGLRWSGHPFPSSASTPAPTPAPLNRGLMKSTDSLQRATNSLGWINGGIAWTYHNNCITGAVEAETGQYVGWLGDAGNPKVGDIYYVHVVVSTVGNACVGTRANVQLIPPPNTYLAITQTNPVYCFYTNPQNVTSRNTANCPQSLASGLYGYSLNPVNSTDAAWPLALGATIEIQVPVYSTAVMSGIATSTYLQAYVQAIDGSFNPSASPNVGQFVYPNSPSITYTLPSATSITNTTARTNANIFNHYVTGSVYFDIGTTTAYGTSAPPGTIPNTWDSGVFWQDWVGLTPGTPYHWRARLVTGGGTTFGVDQAFMTTGVAPPPTSVRGDLDGDGKADIVLRNTTTGQVGGWIMNGASIASGGAVGTSTSTIAGVGDLNGDGKADILLRDTLGNLGAWLMNGTTIASGGSVGSPGAYTVAGLADFTGDNMADILLRDSGGNLGLWTMSGTTVTGGGFVGSPGAYTVAGLGDFNGDGKADILLRDSLGNLGAWLMNGSTVTGGGFVGSPGAYTVAGVADFNGDGKADILLRDSLGNLGLWFMSGSTVTGGGFVGSPGAYTVAAVNDYNGDGKADILLRDSLGNLGMWLMNGSTIVSGGPVSSASGFTVY